MTVLRYKCQWNHNEGADQILSQPQAKLKAMDRHLGVCQFLFGDGTVHEIKDSIDRRV